MAPTAMQRTHASTQGKQVTAAAHPEITGLQESPNPKADGEKKLERDIPELSPEKSPIDYDGMPQDDEESDASAVQLRGLPFRATVEDVQVFLREHAKMLKDDNSIRLLLNRHGRPSGFARVQFHTQQEAQACRDALHTAPMDDRYVEVFIYSEWPKRTRSKKAPSMGGEHGLNGDGELGPDAPCATKQEVLVECREGLKQQQQGGNSMVLLSTLGALLSPEGRAFLRRTDQGLKHFLSQYPEEFVVEGAKGCEAVGLRGVGIRLEEQLCNSHVKPPMQKPLQNFSPPPQQLQQDKQFQDDMQKSKTAEKVYLRSWADPETFPAGLKEWNMPRTPIPENTRHGNISDLAPVPEDVPVSPPPSGNRTNPQHFGTPSDWGTPKPFPSPSRKGGSLTNAASQTNIADAAAQTANLYDRLSKNGAFAGVQGLCDMSALAGCPPWAGDMSTAAWAGQAPPMWPGWPNIGFWGAGGFNGMGGFPGSPAGTSPVAAMEAMGAMGSMPGTPSTPEKMPNPAFMNMMLNQLANGMPFPPTPPMPSLGLASQKMSEEDQLAAEMGCSVPPLTMNLAADLSLNDGFAGSYQAAVRLRGLPFEASEQDILTLFASHNIVDRVEDASNAVQLLKKPNGKPSGQAVVQLRGRGDAQIAQQVLHGKYMGSRYVEVFACDAGSDGRRLEAGPDAVMSPAGNGFGGGPLSRSHKNQGQNPRGHGASNKDHRGRNQSFTPPPAVCESI